MTYHAKQISAGEFKVKCLKLMDVVNQTHIPLMITKRGKPIAYLIPAEQQAFNAFGCMADSTTIHGDIVSPIEFTCF